MSATLHREKKKKGQLQQFCIGISDTLNTNFDPNLKACAEMQRNLLTTSLTSKTQ